MYMHISYDSYIVDKIHFVFYLKLITSMPKRILICQYHQIF